MSVVLTEKAAKEVQRTRDEQKVEDEFLRVAVGGGGCSGFSYQLHFDKAFDAEKDDQYEFHGVKLVVDKRSAMYLNGTTIDYYDGLEERGFQFKNPNATKTCGCGSSFQV